MLGPSVPDKSLASLLPGPVSHPMQRGMLAPLMPRPPAMKNPADACDKKYGNQHNTEDQIHLLVEYVAFVVVRPKGERNHLKSGHRAALQR